MVAKYKLTVFNIPCAVKRKTVYLTYTIKYTILFGIALILLGYTVHIGKCPA